MRNWRMTTLVTVICLSVAACDGDPDFIEQQSTADGASLQLDGQIQSDESVSCDVPQFDFAEQLFTEVDRQWDCAVLAEGLDIRDQLFFSRAGTASMTRFRDVYWNRSIETESINVASPAIAPFVLSNLSSSNTVLTFELLGATGRVEAYDCILVGREGFNTGMSRAIALH